MPLQPIKAKQVSSLGESPAEARERMKSSGPAAPSGEARPPLGQEVKGPLQPQHIAAIREAEEGFKSPGRVWEEPEEFQETIEPPTPSKAMEVIRQLSQDKLQLQTELEAALTVVERYRNKYGELD